MELIYDKQSNITMPDGTVWTPEQLQSSKFYRPLIARDCVITTTSDGVLRSFQPLADLKDAYGVTTEDPAQALAEIQQKRAEAEQQAQEEASTISDLQAQMDALAGYSGQSV